jgi:hypothetical protein
LPVAAEARPLKIAPFVALNPARAWVRSTWGLQAEMTPASFAKMKRLAPLALVDPQLVRAVGDDAGGCSIRDRHRDPLRVTGAAKGCGQVGAVVGHAHLAVAGERDAPRVDQVLVGMARCDGTVGDQVGEVEGPLQEPEGEFAGVLDIVQRVLAQPQQLVQRLRT